MIHDALAKGPLPNPVGAYKTEQPAGANPLVFALNLNYQGQSSDHVNIISFRMCIFYQKINNLIGYSLFSSTLFWPVYCVNVMNVILFIALPYAILSNNK